MNSNEKWHTAFETWWKTRRPSDRLHPYKAARQAYVAGCEANRLAATDVEPLHFTYRNWRGEVSERRVRPISIRFGSTEWHPEPQWLLRARDLDKDDEREFAMRDIGAPPSLSPYRPRLKGPEERHRIRLRGERA